MVNGQKVKIVRMAPAQAAPAPPSPAPKPRQKATKTHPKVTILRNQRPQPQVVVSASGDVIYGSHQSQQVFEETVEQEVEVSQAGEAVETQYVIPQDQLVSDQAYVQELDNVQIIQEGVPAQIFDQDEGSIQVQEIDPEMATEEQMIVEGSEQQIFLDENGVQYVQVFNAETGQNEHIALEHQVV
jgi:hypothetical protein